MIGYVTLGTNDVQGAGKFYDALLAELGATRMRETDTFIAWSAKPGGSALSVTEPADRAGPVGDRTCRRQPLHRR